jgi:hypothetical protein
LSEERIKKQVKKLFFCAARRIAFRHCVAIRRGETTIVAPEKEKKKQTEDRDDR